MFGEGRRRLFVAVGHEPSVRQTIAAVGAEREHEHIGAAQQVACRTERIGREAAAGRELGRRNVGRKPPVVPHALDAFEIGGVGQWRSVEQEAEVVGDDLRCIERAEGIDEGMPVGECRGNVLPDVLGKARPQREDS